MAKTEVYSWRLSPQRKAALEAAARQRKKSLARLLDEITAEWLAYGRKREGDDEERQRQLHAATMEFVGALHGGRPDRSQSARQDLRSSLALKHGRRP